MTEHARLVISVDSTQVRDADSALGSLGQTASATSGLIQAALAIGGAAGVSGLIEQADAYSQMADRMRMATASAGEFVGVQERLLDSANRTYRPLVEAQELYIRTADSLRAMGSSTRDVLDITDSFSYLLVTNAASADRASSAISAYSKAIQTGKVESDGWQSIMAAMPTVVDSLADATGRTTAEIRKLGIEGDLSISELNEALRASAEANGKLADSMSTSVGDALTALSNATQTYIGQLNESTGATGMMAEAIGLLSGNIDSVAGVLAGAAVGALTLYGAKITLSVTASLAARTANIAQAESALQAAIANQRAAQSATMRAAQEALAARGTAVQTTMSIQLAEARMAEAAATAQVSAAQATLRATSLGVLGALGGPVGLALLAGTAAAAFFLFRDSSDDAAKSLEDLKQPLDDVIGKFKILNEDQRKGTLVEWSEAQALAAAQAKGAFDELAASIRNAVASPSNARESGYASQVKEYADLVGRLKEAQAAGESLAPILEGLRGKSGISDDQINSWLKQAKAVSDANGVLETAASVLRAATTATQENTSATEQNNRAKAGMSEAGETYIGTLQKQLARLQDNGSAIKEAERWIRDHADATDIDKAAVLSAAQAIEATEKVNRAAGAATKSLTSDTKKHATEVENQAKKLAEFVAGADLAVKSSNAMADAYLAGANAVEALALAEKIEAEVLKQGEGARTKVTKAMTDQAAAADRLDIGKRVSDLRLETAENTAQAAAVLGGKSALEKFNAEKMLAAALSGKNATALGVETTALKKQIAEYQASAKALENATQYKSIVDRLDPAAASARTFAAEQAILNEQIAKGGVEGEKAAAMLVKLRQEYDDNTAATGLWGKLTEGAIDRVDEAFANAWLNIDEGFDGFADGLKKGFKQLLAEMAHEAITKPILVSFGNAILGTNKSGGIGDVLGNLFGSSGGGGGGGGSGGGMGGIAQNLYSAYSAITGVGADIAAGYASGGISGAINGGLGYYGNMLGNMSSTLTSGFGSVVGAITGQTAANAASAAAAQAAGAAAGNSLGVNAGAYAATSGGGMAAGMSSALSSAAAMWPLAVVMGMFQSGKLYDAGVRPDAGETLAAGGGTLAGNVVMSGPAIQSLQFEVIDKVLGGIVGGKAAAIISGSTFSQALWGGIGKALFGGDWKTKKYGYEFGVEDGGFEGRTFQEQKKKGGLFSSGKSRTIFGELSTEQTEYFEGLYAATEVGVQTLFEKLNVTFDEGALDGFNVAASRIQTKGINESDITAAVAKWFETTSDAMTQYLSDGAKTGLGEGLTTARLAELVQSLEVGNAVLETLDVKLFQISPKGALAADALVKLMGGIEGLTTATGTYYEAFFTADEQWSDFAEGIADQWENIEQTLPTSRGAFRDLVEGLDLMTEAGRGTFQQLMNLSPQMDQYYQGLESQAQALAQANTALAESRQQGSDSVAQAAGGLRDSIFMDLLGDDQARYAYEKSQADSLAQLLPALTSISDITDVVGKITQLTSSAYGRLDDRGKAQEGKEFIEFLDQIQAKSQEQIAKSQEEISQREAAVLEAAINRAGDKMAADLARGIGSGNENQASLYAVFGSIVAQFGAYTAQLSRSGREVTG